MESILQNLIPKNKTKQTKPTPMVYRKNSNRWGLPNSMLESLMGIATEESNIVKETKGKARDPMAPSLMI